MMPRSTTPPAAAPTASPRRILIATTIALAVAAVVLLVAVLPAEYGIDPLGTGRALGLNALARARPGVVAVQPSAHREDGVVFVLAPFESVEYKYRIELGGSMVYSWQATGPVIYELHSEPDGAPEGYAESFDKAEATEAHGAYTAPFSGIHGWFWENRGREDVTITLTTAGFFSGALEFRDGGVYEHAIAGLDSGLQDNDLGDGDLDDSDRAIESVATESTLTQ